MGRGEERGSDVEAISVTILPRATVSASLLKSDTLVLASPTLLPSPHTHTTSYFTFRLQSSGQAINWFLHMRGKTKELS